MEWTVKPPVYGDMVRTKVSFYYHYGIFADEEQVIQFGLPHNVTQSADEVKVLSTDIDAFLAGGELEVAQLSRKERAQRRSPEQTVAIALSRLGEGGYHILHNNCEHFVQDCMFGEKTSSFIDNLRAGIRRKLENGKQ